MSNFIEINLKLIKLPKNKKYIHINIKKYKIRVSKLKPDPNPDPNRLHPGRVRSWQYPDPARGFAISTSHRKNLSTKVTM